LTYRINGIVNLEVFYIRKGAKRIEERRYKIEDRRLRLRIEDRD